jgi:hypothetical protein
MSLRSPPYLIVAERLATIRACSWPVAGVVSKAIQVV